MEKDCTGHLTVVGCDPRMIYFVQKAAEKGFSVSHIHDNRELDECGVFGTTILPLPYKDANNIIKGTDILISDFLRHLDGNSGLVLGKADDCIMKAAATIGFEYIDINEDEYFKKENAIPTAEAALRIAMSESDMVLSGKNVTVCGFGAIAKRIVRLLEGFNTNVTVVARNPSDRFFAMACGCKAISFAELKNVIENEDVVFNTCPAMVLTRDELKNVKQDCVIVDLASLPGGCDFNFAETKGINCKLYLKLPEKYYPASAKEIFADEVFKMIEKLKNEYIERK